MIILRFINPEDDLRLLGPTSVGSTIVAAVIGGEGPEGPAGASVLSLDPKPDNIITTGPDGLYATTTWKTTDW